MSFGLLSLSVVEAFPCLTDDVAENVNFLKSGVAAKTDTDGAVYDLNGDFHCLKDMAASALLAGGTLGDIDFF